MSSSEEKKKTNWIEDLAIEAAKRKNIVEQVIPKDGGVWGVAFKRKPVLGSPKEEQKAKEKSL